MNFRKVDAGQSFPKMEEEILKFWEEEKIFEKSLEKTRGGKPYTFFDGPPFATGTPHHGHIVGSVMKDVVPRFWTMKGRYVERKWGWDCHGLPIENLAEKELGFRHKKDIEAYGVDKFNEFCRSKVLGYVDDWKKVITRLGRWADMENAYKTMDLKYMESVWWVFKELWDKGLIYEGYRSMHICTRCETTLSQQEVSEGYKDIKDLSVVAKFELLSTNYEKDTNVRKEDEAKTYILAWTTTPWTLIGNVALAVGKDIEYVKVKIENDAIDHRETKSTDSTRGTSQYAIVDNGTYIISKDAFLRTPALYIPALNFENQYQNYTQNGKNIDWEKCKNIKLIKGSELVGKSYKPLFDYYQTPDLENAENGWKIYAGDFVTTEDGVGVVHIAPAFGEDDMNLGKENNLPFIQHVKMDGTIKEQAVDFAGMNVKSLENHMQTDIEIIKYLAKHGTLFSKEKYEHSYPHCWRCDTPLINYATTSWFVNVGKVKERALKLVKEITWFPAHIKDGRFGKWLEGARDWSISRQRFWASVMPIWRCECGEMKVFGSVDELREKTDQKVTKILFVRHGESENNVKNIISDSTKLWPLTENGKKGTAILAKKIEDKIDVIFTSPVLRTKETASIINQKINVEIIESDLLRELNFGEWNDKKKSDLGQEPSYAEYKKIKSIPLEKFNYKLGLTGESRRDVMDRAIEFIKEVSAGKYAGKTILVVGHWITYDVFRMYAEHLEPDDYFKNNLKEIGHDLISTFYFGEGGTLFDLHKDKLDGLECKCEKCGGVMKRVPDVLDTWFDSGSMPYAQQHYPFENQEKFENGFPAEFIAEGVDQTRAWFYYLHLIATAIKDKNAFNHVIVNGIVLAEDGKKMSKRLQNYPDPTYLFDKYGADALRFYLMSSPVVAADNLNFKEADVSDLVRGMFRMLWNSYSFFALYANIDGFDPKKKNEKSENLLDKWILSELHILIKEVNENMEKYDLARTARLFPKFIDNLSNWYIRRSRKRFWKSENDNDKDFAYQTLHTVLVELSKLMAPFTPFMSEEIYKNLTGEKSVHLAEFPVADESLIDEKLNKEMEIVREVINQGLAIRSEQKIKVRQPLSDAMVNSIELSGELRSIICEELNIKNIESLNKNEIDKKLVDDLTSEMEGTRKRRYALLNDKERKFGSVSDRNALIALNTEMTSELKLEGQAREIVRFIQEMRKQAGYEVENHISVQFKGMGEVFEKFSDLIAKETLSDSIEKGAGEGFDLKKELEIDGMKVIITVRR